MDVEEFKNKIEIFFTADGLELVINYIESLKTHMEKSEVNNNQQEVVINGIIEFIDEFGSSYQNSKINFSDSLKIIDEIGSPSEIIQSFEFAKDYEEDKLQCPSCKWKNEPKSTYCEFCGKSLSNLNDAVSIKTSNIRKRVYTNLTQKINQEFIDHPYPNSIFLSSMLISVLIFTIGFNRILVAHSLLEFIAFFIAGFVSSFFVSLFPALLIGVIVGFIIDLKYKSEKSLKFRQAKIIKYFERNVALGFIMVFGGITFGISFYALASNSFILPLLVLIWFASIILDTIIVLYYDKSSERPTKLNLTELNKLKLLVDKNNNQKFIQYNLKIIPIVIIISLLISLLNLSYLSTIENINLVMSGILLVFLYILSFLMISNGFLLIQVYSWREISKNYLKKSYQILNPVKTNI